MGKLIKMLIKAATCVSMVHAVYDYRGCCEFDSWEDRGSAMLRRKSGKIHK